ncbi:hypothetical protein ACFVUS_08480 [Nocardia sp. NPDC058058]|uniref:hypothetical protein n=1 Tax=Nocardia sp. NPDC058058 TaxID=3346317 RepID=UPI0036DF0563
MTLLKADIEQINALATVLDGAAAKIDALDVRGASTSIAGALPGTPLGEACEQGAEYIEGAWLRVSQRIAEVAGAMRQSAAGVSATDESFRGRLEELNFRLPGEPR